jgi:NTE family protein
MSSSKHFLRIVQLGLLLIGCLAANAPSLADGVGGARPRIGLALSGGGARGAAHIGVLKVLEEMRIPVDYVAGTSMGSIVGALYAAGMSADEISQAMADIDWDSVFSDDTRREDLSFRRKQDDRLFLVKHKPGIKDGTLKLPMALVQGQKFDLVLRELLLPVSRITDFDRLPIPFRAVATDIGSGREVVLKSGDLARAVRASMAVPGAFAAVDIGGQTLVDGGMSNNLPVSVVRQMGADIVIAVDISTPLLKREEITSVLGVVEQLTGFLTRRNTEEQIGRLRQGDLLIVPPLDEAAISSGDFKRHAEAIAIGEQAARQKLAGFGRVASHRTAVRHSTHRSLRQETTERSRNHAAIKVAFVEIENHSTIRDEVIAAHFGIQPGDDFDLQYIEDGIARTYGLGFFEKIDFVLEAHDGDQGIRLRVYEKSWGTSSLQLGLELFTARGQASSFNLGGAITYAPFGANAGEWRTRLSLGEEQHLITDIYYPLDAAHKWFVGGDLGYESTQFKLFDRGTALAEYDVSRFGTRLRFGHNLDTWGRVQLEFDRAKGSTEIITGQPSLLNYDYDVGKLSLMGAVDTLDNLYFPRHGAIGNMRYQASRTGLGASADYDQLSLDFSTVRSWDDHSLQVGANLGVTLDQNAPIEGRYRLGGFMRLSGLERNALSGQHMALLRGMYRYRLNDILVPVHAGLSLEVGNVWDRTDDISLANSRWGGSLFLAADTPLGPAVLSYGHTDGQENALYLLLGKTWQ